MGTKKQKTFEGMERKVDKEIAAAAEAYVAERDKRMQKSVDEKQAKEALIAIMKKKGVNVYRDDDADPPVVITLSEKSNVKVTEVEDDQGGEAEEETKH